MTIGNHISVNQILLVEHQMLPDENWSRLEYIVSVELLPNVEYNLHRKTHPSGCVFCCKKCFSIFTKRVIMRAAICTNNK